MTHKLVHICGGTRAKVYPPLDNERPVSMRILPQSASASYSHFPAQPHLMLNAPHIAGLLPARVPSSEPPPNVPAPFIFDRPALADLTAVQREHLYEAADVLLEMAVEFMVGTFSEDALRAAEVIFHRGVGAKSALRPLGPAAFNAEVDADWLELLARAQRSRPITHTEAQATVRRARAQRKSGAV